jgi:hypothetical protein
MVAHLKQKHGENAESWRCLTTVITGCTRDFPTKAARTNHIKKDHPPKSIPCPYREELGCEVLVTHETALRSHLSHHGKPEYKCPEPDCDKCYFRLSDLTRYREIHRLSFVCVVPRCHCAVSGALFTEQNIQRHMKNHNRCGHLDGLKSYPEPLGVSENQ